MIQKALYIIVAASAIFFSGMEYQKSRIAQVTVTQLVKDQKSDVIIEDHTRDRQAKRDAILKTVQAKQIVWFDQPLPGDAVTSLLDAGIPERPKTP